MKKLIILSVFFLFACEEYQIVDFNDTGSESDSFSENEDLEELCYCDKDDIFHAAYHCETGKVFEKHKCSHNSVCIQGENTVYCLAV